MKEYKELLKLIKASQFSEVYIADKSVDWGVIYDEAAYQVILGLITSVIPKDVIVSDSKWQKAIYRQKASYIRYIHAETELVRIMDNAVIPFVILKGNSAAIYYTKPKLRAMGDIDFLVLQKDFEKTRELLIENGFKLVKESKRDTRHIGFEKDGVFFELHHHFSYEDLDIEDYIVDGLNKRTMAKIDNHFFPMLPTMENGLILLAHMRNHLKTGVGMRQIIDWMMFVHSELSDEVWDTVFKKIVKEKGLEKLAITVTRMCQIYMGLPEDVHWCRDADKDVCRRLIRNLFNTGNFGGKNKGDKNIERVFTSFRRQGYFNYLQYAGECNWSAYHRHSWLKPFAWIYQAIKYIRLGLNSRRWEKGIKADIRRGKERAELLKDLGI